MARLDRAISRRALVADSRPPAPIQPARDMPPSALPSWHRSTVPSPAAHPWPLRDPPRRSGPRETCPLPPYRHGTAQPCHLPPRTRGRFETPRADPARARHAPFRLTVMARLDRAISRRAPVARSRPPAQIRPARDMPPSALPSWHGSTVPSPAAHPWPVRDPPPIQPARDTPPSALPSWHGSTVPSPAAHPWPIRDPPRRSSLAGRTQVPPLTPSPTRSAGTRIACLHSAASTGSRNVPFSQ